MTRKTPSDFISYDDWLSHVRREIPVREQPYTLAVGRTELFRSFFGALGQVFPASIAMELERIDVLHDHERTAALETLNNAILANLTRLLADQALPNMSVSELRELAPPRDQIRHLRSHLAQENPYFALWVAYQGGVINHSTTEDWDSYVLRELVSESTEKIEFAHAMAELDKLFTAFHDENRALPSLSFERIWFLHHLRGPERMAQTCAVLGMLTAELAACTSA